MTDCYRLRADCEQAHVVADCEQWRDDGYSTCATFADQGYSTCKEYADQGYQRCTQWSKNCVSWLRWICNAFEWVCTATVWVSNLVCVSFVWVANIVCVVWVWVAVWVCVAWRFIVPPVWQAICFALYILCRAPEVLLNLMLKQALWIFVTLQCLFRRRDTRPNSRTKPGLTLSFEDTFSTPGVNPNNWITHVHNGDFWNYGVPDNYLSPTSYSFHSGAIDLLAENVPITVGGRNFNYQTAHLEWRLPIEQRHGYFEIRCKIPDTVGMWPAFWLASRQAWPPEIDIFEFYTQRNRNRFETTLHWGSDVPDHPKETWRHPACNPSKFFRIYGCAWDATSIRWYYDNVLIRVSATGLSAFIHPMYVIVNTAVDSRNGAPNAVFPSHFIVDYVRVWS
jgi:hypothetical protein